MAGWLLEAAVLLGPANSTGQPVELQWSGTACVSKDRGGSRSPGGRSRLGIDEGFCLEIDRRNTECTPDLLRTCEAWAAYQREAGLEVGAVELFVLNAEALCEFPPDFALCQVNSEPKLGSDPSFFPPGVRLRLRAARGAGGVPADYMLRRY